MPILIYEAYFGFSSDFMTVLTMVESKWYINYNFYNAFKIFKLLQYLRIMSVLNGVGQKMDRLFPHKKVLILNMQKIMWVTIRFCLNIHIMTCLLVIVSSARIEKERDEFR